MISTRMTILDSRAFWELLVCISMSADLRDRRISNWIGVMCVRIMEIHVL